MKTNSKSSITDIKLSESKESLHDIHKHFKKGKQLTEEQLDKLCHITDMGQLGLATGGIGLGYAYLDFCFNNKLSDSEIQMKISALYNFIKQTGKSPMNEEQLGHFVDFLQMGWDDVAVAYLDFCNNESISLDFSENNNITTI